MASYSTTTLLLLFCAVQFSYGQVRTESVKIPLCNSYDTTSFTTPNVFNHTSQDEAIHHMHTFAPLVATFCHNEILFFLCMVHIPYYRQEPDAPPVFQPVCRSLCDDVYTQCKFAMDKLNFYWPDEISCGKFANTSCISGGLSEDPFVEIPDNCSVVSYSGGSPICSSVISSPPDNKYFIDTNNPFTNYFGHKTQQEAMFELSTHGKLINLLISQQPYVNRTNEVTQCLNNIRFLLCNLYLPRCRDKTPSDYPITAADCKNTLERNCSSAILQLQNRGYNITWPPVNVDCDKFPQTSGNAPQFKSDRTFGGLSPPPPAVIHGNVGPDFLEVKWNSFPEEYKFGTTVETGILYRKSGSRVQYNHELVRTNSFTLRGLNSSTTYEILVGTVNSNAMYPGTFEEIKLKPAQGVERIKLGFCSSLYNFTKLPNIFGHKTQDEAINSAHKFGPLLDTGCSSDLKALICSAHFPNYLAKSQTTQLPCRSLCERVSDRCSYAIDKLNFLWPKELNCENLPQQESCYQPSSLPEPIASDVCEHVQEQSICSLITKPNQTSPYFATVEKKFKNYFNHTSQEQAVYELSKHSKLLSLLSTLIAFESRNSAAHTTCVQKLAYFLCSFYLPNCRAGIEISQADCKSIVGTDIGQQHVCSQSVSRLQQFRFAINWPPVQVDCNSISASVGTPKVEFNEIRFQDILPPPPAIRYSTTSEKRLDITWLPQGITSTERVSGYEFLFKPPNTKIAYNLFIHPAVQLQLTTSLTVDTSKDYEIFVAVLDADDGMPGYFQRILYTAGSTVHDLPLDVGGPCERYFPQTVLPNSFGDSNITAARTRLYPFYPLIHTLCSEELAAFLCSVIFPRYYFGQQRPCQSVCKKIRTSCSYATSRTKFFWPQEFTCDRDTFEVDECFDVTKVSASQNLPPVGTFGLSRLKRAVTEDECKPTTTAMCLAVVTSFPESEQQGTVFKSTVSNSRSNYFKHSSTDEAIFELSQHLRLLSTLREYATRGNSDAGNCNRDLTVLLCHLYLPICPREPLAERLCIDTLSPNSTCFKAVKQFNDDGHDLKWPPVEVNCQDRNWFSPNATVFNVQISTVTFPEPPPPPPTNIVVPDKTSDGLSVKFTLIDPSFSDERGVALLYRRNDSQEAYSFLRTERTVRAGSVTLNMQKLNPKTDYEIKVATLSRAIELPGIFRTITDRTFDAGVIDVPITLDICYNYYRKASLPNMYGDKIVETAKQRFLPFYPLVHTFCSSELETFLCSVFFPRYDSVTFISQKPCRKACERVYGSCKYAIARSKFFWPPELECGKFSNDANCYNLTRDVTLPSPDRFLETDIEPLRLPLRRRRETSAECKPTPSTPICSNVLAGLEIPSRYFRTTFQHGNYFGHDSTDEAVYELSKFANLLSSLLRPDDPVNSRSYEICYRKLTILLCHLHLPVCPRSPLDQDSCLDSVGNTSVCFNAIKDLNSKGANFAWPPVKVNCENITWFRSDVEVGILDVSLNNPFGPPAPRNVQIIPRYPTRLIATYNDTDVSNTTALYRRLGTATAYQTTTINPTSGFDILTLEQLMPATDYEIKLARLRNSSGLPGPFETHTSNTFGQCQNDTTGDEVAQGKILWTTQDGNTTQTRKCPYGDNGLKAGDPSRSCKCDVPDVCKNPFWLEPDTIGCSFNDVDDGITLTLSSIAEMLIKNERSSHNASEELVDITSKYASEFTEDDLVLSTLILENIVQDAQQLSKNGPNIVKIIDNLLNSALNVLVDSQKNSNATARIVVVLDQFLENIPLKPGQNFTQNEANIAVYTQEYDPRDFEGAGAASIVENTMENLVVYDSQSSVQTSISQVSLTMPKSLFRDLDIDTKSQNQRISFAIYRKTSFFTSLETKRPTSQTNTVRRQNSFVVSGSVKGLRLTNLTDPIRTTYEPLEPGVDETTACVFWNFTDDNGVGDWSPAGCSFQGIEDGIVTCHCTHLTNFAILMDVHIDDRDDDHDEALSIISYIGCAISLVGLILTIITVLIFKELRSKAPTQILLNFCIALSLTLIVFLAGAERSRTSSLAACRAAAIALHYFVLAMFVWTSIQAYNMYLAFVKVMPRYHSKFILKCCVVGWGLPAVIVIIAAALAIEEYGDENFCRVQGLPFQIGFLAPVVLILVVNSIAFALIIRSLLKAGSKVAADKRATGLQHARRGAAILVVLGLTWLFGVLAIRDAKLVFQYLFCIFNSIQGLLVFIFYCVLSSETKAKYRKLLGGKGKESDTSGKHRYPGSSSEGKFREINSNKKKSNVYTTNTGSSSLPQTKHDVEMARM